MTYAEKLRDYRWDQKRDIILKRDGYRCKRCDEKENLEVHHLEYRDNLDPWEYENEVLVTLCRDCHHFIYLAGSNDSIVNPWIAYERLKKKIPANFTPQQYQRAIMHIIQYCHV